jgi:hypothetical protein
VAHEPSDDRLSKEQAFEAAYRFVAQYYDRERIEPFFLMLVSMGWEGTQDMTNDPATWEEWKECVRQTVAGDPLPELTSPE